MSSDMGDVFRAWRAKKQVRKDQRLATANAELDDGKWTKHTEYHWSRMIPGDPYPSRLDYWPSTNKYRLDDLSGHVPTRGDAANFVRKLLGKDHE
jgi:hypothetical protein